MRAVVRLETRPPVHAGRGPRLRSVIFLVGALSGSLGRLPTQATLLPRTDRGR
ncbi:hypothetical protein PJI17_16300 [Mycobacterium kansasii]